MDEKLLLREATVQEIEDARKLAEIAEQEEWAGEIVVYEDQDEIDRALGIGRLPWGLLSIWWD